MSNFIKRVFDGAIKTFKYGCIVYCFVEFVGDVVLCSGPSMEPTIITNDVVLTEHLSSIFGAYKKGDIVISRSPSKPQEFVCKRISGMPGSKVKQGFKSITVPRGHVWLEGDNKWNSTDSRNYGPIPLAMIRGRVVCKIWPPDDAKIMTS